MKTHKNNQNRKLRKQKQNLPPSNQSRQNKNYFFRESANKITQDLGALEISAGIPM